MLILYYPNRTSPNRKSNRPEMGKIKFTSSNSSKRLNHDFINVYANEILYEIVITLNMFEICVSDLLANNVPILYTHYTPVCDEYYNIEFP